MPRKVYPLCVLCQDPAEVEVAEGWVYMNSLGQRQARGKTVRLYSLLRRAASSLRMACFEKMNFES